MDTKGEGAPTTAMLFEAAISYGQQSTVRYLRSIYPAFDFGEPWSVRTLAKTLDLDMLKLIYSYSPDVVSFGFDDHMTSMPSLAIEEGPQNAPFILFLLDHGAMSLYNGSYTYHLGCELLPAITNDQPIEVIKRMVPLTARLSFPKMTAINRKRADALEVFLNEEQKRMRGTQSSEDLESTLQSVRSTGDKELIAVVERHIHKVEQQAAKDAQKNSRSTKILRFAQFAERLHCVLSELCSCPLPSFLSSEMSSLYSTNLAVLQSLFPNAGECSETRKYVKSQYCPIDIAGAISQLPPRVAPLRYSPLPQHKKWWQFGMREKPTEKTAPTDSSSLTRSGGSSWWPSLSKTGHDPKSPEMIQQKKEVYDSSSDEETV